MQKQVIIEIDAGGNCSIEGKGFVGPECSSFIQELEQSLGTKTFQKDKPEYLQRNPVRDRNLQTGGR